MRVQSKKAKGRRLSALVKAYLLKCFIELESEDITVTPSGVNGPDLQFSPKAKKYIPYDIECKNQEGFSKLYASFDQALNNTEDGRLPMLVVKSNRKPALVVVPLEGFLDKRK